MLTIHASKQETITLNDKEFFFLAGIIGSDRLLGVEDPFIGFLTEDIAVEWENAKQSLLGKQYLIQEEGGELSIPPEVFSRVAIAGLAERACWLKYENEESSFEGYLHVTDERVIQVCKSEDDHRCYMLSELGTIEQTCDSIVGDLALSEQNWGDIPALLLSRKEFGDIYTSATDYKSADISDRLARLTDDAEGSIALAKCLKNRVSSGELQLSIWNGISWESQNAAFIVNESMNWLLRMSLEGDQDWLTAAPATKEQFRHMILTWLKQ
ncbi:hypothetical protein JCM10914A_53670 [Paenibacillus sp. JCM 10914]|uniref:hypothetical protein n=1 Tax=Paenibacillus sp. JCM 10914 TaxID=1236974 RepID=UPI0003CC4A86|nr:hypothetical protein [Paenibacillus sp. JCM 10914]GAE04904.1 hypothetical protein JCM10914_978 [Paenibacillus sp. JCM 10914]